MKLPLAAVFAFVLSALLSGAPARTPAPSPSAPPADSAPKPEPRAARMLKARWNVRVDVQMVALPEARALQLLPELQSDQEARVEDAFAQIQEMIKKKEATLLAWPSLITLDGERGVSESIVEKKYPTDFDPPIVPQNVGGPGPATPTSLVPKAWEVRNCGETLEVEPKVLDEGKRILLEIVPQRVELLRFETYDTGKTKDGSATQVVQPEFATQKFSGTLIVRSGRRVLLSVHKLSIPEGYIEFFLLKAVATPAE